MSLNGLDDVKVKEAHETAAAEPGGWFLLKYSSRDEVEILGKGNGGIVEIRNAIAAYEEPTPLFGFLRYRRRNVLIKYVPEECSRLVQARVAVHFNAVTERFNPHDTTFSITSSKELKDSTLSAACSLHTASGSTSSSTSSLRRRRLMEITEDEEEDNRAKRQSTVHEERATLTKPFDIPLSALPPLEISLPENLTTGPPQSSTDYRAIIADLETSPPPPRETVIFETVRPKSPTKSVDERRKSSQSTRPDLHSYSSYGSNGKPKIKLGPRPSLDVGGRPHTSASGPTSHFRPVSSLPAGLKLSKTPSKREHKDRPHTQHSHSQEPPSMTISPPPIPENTTFSPQPRPHTSGGRPTTSSGVSIRPPASPSAMSTKFPHMTPEKARLMKALELRKKRETAAVEMAAAKDALLLQATLPTLEERPVSTAPSKEVQDTLQMLNDMAETAGSRASFDAPSTLKTDESDATRSDSSPVSPVGASEKAESTRASSVSGSTDETVQEQAAAKPETPELIVSVEKDELVAADSPLEDETEHTPIPVVEEKKVEDLYMLLPHTYTPPIRSPTSETKEHIEEVEPASYGLPPPGMFMQNSADLPLTEVSYPEHEQSSEPPHIAEPEREEESFVDETSEVGESRPPVPVKEWKIPRSKFSRENFKAENETPAVPSQALPTSRYEHKVDAPEKSPVGSTFSNDSKNALHTKKKRRALVDPIRTEGLTDQSASDAHFSSDEDFMDELQSAVVQEATPFSVKTPTNAEFSDSQKKGNRFSRTFSNPLRKDKSDPTLLGSSSALKQDGKRSVSASAAYLNKINQQESRPVAKKVNLGSGISQRIKALEKLSSASPAATTPNAAVTTSGSGTSFFSIRKASVRESNSSPSVAERANSISRNTPPPSASRESSPEVSKIRDRSGSIQSRVDTFRSSPTPLARTHVAKPESISVNARIIRDPDQLLPAKPEIGKDPSEFKPLELKESTLVISHQRAGVDPPKETIQERRLSRESSTSAPKNHVRERRSSITVIKDFISDLGEGRTSFSDRRRSMNLEFSSTKSPTKSPSRPPSTHTTRPMSISSRLSFSSNSALSPSPSSTSVNEDKPEKKQSRASRIKNRMSGLTSGRKGGSHAMSPTVREESEPSNFNDSPSLASPFPPPPTSTLVHLGILNWQLIGSVVWRYRLTDIDSQGFLILTSDEGVKDKQGPKRFHFSQFREPKVPDIDMQEMANSVIMDFVTGGCIQVAVNHKDELPGLLKVLQDAHRVWAAYGQ